MAQKGGAGLKSVKKPKTVSKVSVIDRAGKKVILRSIDSDSKTLGEDFLYVFTQNVKKARSENKSRKRRKTRARPKGKAA